MLPWQVPRACRMSWSSLTAAAASSPQHISGSITSSIRPTPTDRETQPSYQTLSTKIESLCFCIRVKKQHLLCWDLLESGSVHYHGDSFHCLAQAGSVWFSHSWLPLDSFCDLQKDYRPVFHPLLWEASAEWSGSLPENTHKKKTVTKLSNGMCRDHSNCYTEVYLDLNRYVTVMYFCFWRVSKQQESARRAMYKNKYNNKTMIDFVIVTISFCILNTGQKLN